MILQRIITCLSVALIIPTCQVTDKKQHTNIIRHNISLDQSNSVVHGYEISLAPDLEIDIYNILFYHVKHSRSQPLSIPSTLRKEHYRLVILIIRGDISMNPGYKKKPVWATVAKNHRAVLCEGCYYWWYIKCANISPSEYHLLSNSDDPWVCKPGDISFF